MTDPRVSLGYEVEADVTGPYEVIPAQPDTDLIVGGTLDVGITALRADGTRIVIGEIWAACPNYTAEQGKTRIDAAVVASRIVSELNRE